MKAANSKRNDDFDFGLDEDIDASPPPYKNKPAAKNNDHDFFGLEEDEEERDRLPVINQPSKSKLQPDSKSIGKANTKLQKIPSKDVTYDFLDEEVEEQPKGKPVINSKERRIDSKPASSQAKRQEASYGQQPEAAPLEENKGDDDYGDDFEADAYGQDFEDFHDEPKSPEPATKNSSVGTTIKQPAVVQKAVSTSKHTEQAKTIVKQQSLRKNISRASLKSENSRRSVSKSRAVVSYASVTDQANKFSAEVEKTFPEVQLNGLSIDNLNKLNERVRGMIRKLNDQLNEILTRNTLLLKAKKEGRSRSKGTEQRLKILSEERKNNEKILERMDEQVKKMRHRQGKLKEEDYEIDIHKRILAMTESKKEMEKQIYRLKLDMSNEGKRLTSGTEKKQQDSQNTFKADLVHQKKEELRLIQSLRTVDKKLEEMEPKYAETEQKLNSLIKEAANSGIDLGPVKSSLKSKYDEFSKRHENEKKNLGMLDGLFKSKKEKNTQQNAMLKRNSQNMDAQIRNINSEIAHVIEECKLVIEKASENPRIPKTIEASLQAISQSLVINDSEFDRMTEKSNKSSYSEKPRLQSAGKKKSNSQHQQQEEFLPLNPKKLAKNVEEEHKSLSPAAKPNFKKKEPISGEDRNAQRIWKDEVHNQSNLREPPIIPHSMPVQLNHQKEEQPAEPQKPIVADNSKPAFMLKKRNNNSSLNNAIVDAEPQIPTKEVKLEPYAPNKISTDQQPSPIVQEEVKPVEDKPFGRMMRLRRNEPEKEQNNTPSQQSTIESKPAQASNIESQIRLQVNDNPIVEPSKPEAIVEDKPIMAPRRMMLRKKEQEGEGGYNPTFKKQADQGTVVQPPSKESELAPKPLISNPYAPLSENKPPAQTNNPYAPRTILNDQVHQRPVKDQNSSNNAKPTIQISRRQQQEASPPKEQKLVAPAASINNPVNNPYNPYAPKEVVPNQAPVREREGRLKKPKMQIGKEKITNIYEAAEEPAVNEFIAEKRVETKPVIVLQDAPKPQHKHEQLDINQLLGIGGKKKDEEDELLFGGAKKIQEKKPARRRGQDDFFGGFDV